MLADLCAQPCNLGLRVGLTELAALDEIADVGVEIGTLRQDLVGKLKQFLEIAVPGGKVQCFVKHRHPVDHVVKGDPQFLLTLADLVHQPCIFHRDHRLRRKVLQERDLLVGKWPHFVAERGNGAEQNVVFAQRNQKEDPGATNRVRKKSRF
jgi:hypothetical protein